MSEFFEYWQKERDLLTAELEEPLSNATLDIAEEAAFRAWGAGRLALLKSQLEEMKKPK